MSFISWWQTYSSSAYSVGGESSDSITRKTSQVLPPQINTWGAAVHLPFTPLENTQLLWTTRNPDIAFSRDNMPGRPRVDKCCEESTHSPSLTRETAVCHPLEGRDGGSKSGGRVSVDYVVFYLTSGLWQYFYRARLSVSLGTDHSPQAHTFTTRYIPLWKRQRWSAGYKDCKSIKPKNADRCKAEGRADSAKTVISTGHHHNSWRGQGNAGRVLPCGHLLPMHHVMKNVIALPSNSYYKHEARQNKLKRVSSLTVTPLRIFIINSFKAWNITQVYVIPTR